MKRLLLALLYCLYFQISYAQTAPQLMGDFCSGQCFGNPAFAGTLNGKMILFKWDGVKMTFNTCTALGLYQSDVYKDIWINEQHSSIVIGDFLYFSAMSFYKGRLAQCLLKWDGINDPEAVLLLDSNVHAYNQPKSIAGKVYIGMKEKQLLYNPQDGAVKNIKGATSLFPLAEFRNKIYWQGRDSLLGYELFESDVNGDNLKLVADLYPGPSSGGPGNMTVHDDMLYFSANDTLGNSSIFRYDGITKPERLATYDGYQYFNLMFYKDHLYFIRMFTGSSPVLYLFDLTTNTEKKIAVLADEGISSNEMNIYRNKLFFNTIVTTSVHSSVKAYDLDSNIFINVPAPVGLNSFSYTNAWVFDDALYMQSKSTGLSEIYRYYEEKPVLHGVEMYPNPATSAIYIKTGIDSPQTYNITMHDAVGHIAMQRSLGTYQKGNHTIEVPLHQLAAGIYICTLRGNRGIISRYKLVKL